MAGDAGESCDEPATANLRSVIMQSASVIATGSGAALGDCSYTPNRAFILACVSTRTAADTLPLNDAWRARQSKLLI